MNYEILFAIIVATIFTGMIALPFIKKLRHAFDVPEGWAGLVYQHGHFVRRNNAGRHVIWALAGR